MILKTIAIMSTKKNIVSKQINEVERISREGTNMEYDVSPVVVAWNRLENNSAPAGTAAIQSVWFRILEFVYQASATKSHRRQIK